MFELDSRLAADTVEVTQFDLCRVLLMAADRRWPWLILVPERADVTELHQLSDADRHRLVDEIAAASAVLEEVFAPDKINIPIGAFADPRFPSPTYAVWNRCKHAWVEVPASCESHDRQPDA